MRSIEDFPGMDLVDFFLEAGEGGTAFLLWKERVD